MTKVKVLLAQKLRMFEHELLQLEEKYLLRRPIVIESYDGPRVTIAGKSLLLMCSNDYLGLSNHPKLREAARTAIERYGFGAGASRLVSGTSSLHQELEDRLSRFKGTESAVLFNSGYAANTGLIPAIAGEGDVVLSDSLNHASIIDGCRLSKAEIFVYQHKDMNHLEALLWKSHNARRKLIVTDGVFSMDGDLAPLPDLVFLAEKYGALLMVDDAHGTGVLGKTGRGVVEHFGLDNRVPIQMGTLGKALGSFGAYAAGNRSLIDFLMNRSRSFIYSTALPPAVCAASIAAIDIIEQERALRIKLWQNRERFIAGLKHLGISSGNSESPVVPLIIGDSEKTMKAGSRLYDYGIYASAIRPPTVAEGTARIRMTLMASHTDRDIDAALSGLKRCVEEGLMG
ncbi:MAG: 8-amino-7-oxononanoate synthase [Betaproteobacteria bacterium]